jgi:DNA primase catalytic core
MPTANDLKSADYIERIIPFAEGLLGIKFRRAGRRQYSAHCPFHVDRRSSFRVRVDGNGVVRFHCFGACDMDCDIYDLIRMKRRCSFREAQRVLANHFGVEGYEPEAGKRPPEAKTQSVETQDFSVIFAEPKRLNPEALRLMASAAAFYHERLMEDAPPYRKVRQYLAGRGVDDGLIQEFQIGYAPPFKDEQHQGRAFLKAVMAETKEPLLTHRLLSDAGLIRLLNDGSRFVKYVDFSIQDIFQRAYADFFAGRITFPIFGDDGAVKGIIGRRPDKSGNAWLKQASEKNLLDTRSWLYGIHKAKQYIRRYKTVIIVEGVFDYFAFYRLFMDTSRPIVVATLGKHITDEAMALFKRLGVEHFIVAFDWDTAGKQAIHKAAEKCGGAVHYLGGMKEGEDPADMLKGLEGGITGFSMSRLLLAAKRVQPKTAKPVYVSHIVFQKQPQREVVLKPKSTPTNADLLPVPEDLVNPLKECVYDVEDFLPLLTYDHANQAALRATLKEIVRLLESRPRRAKTEKVFRVPVNFLNDEAYDDLGPALILWLRLVIEQQAKKRRVKQTDSTLAEWLHTSRQTIVGYKRMLLRLGYLKADRPGKVQRLSVKFFTRAPLTQLGVSMWTGVGTGSRIIKGETETLT